MKKYIAMINVPMVVGFGIGFYIGTKYDIRVEFKKAGGK